MIAVDEQGRIAVIEARPTGAAHSMDTDWYAVDRDGRVARMSSGEEGSVPYAAHRQYWEALYQDLALARMATFVPAPAFAEEAALAHALAESSDPTERQLLTAIIAGDRTSRSVYEDWLEQHGRDRERWRPESVVYVVGKEIRRVPFYDLPQQWSGVLRFATREDLELFRAEYADTVRSFEARLGLPDALAITNLPQYIFADYWSAGAIGSAFVLEDTLEPRSIGLYEYACSFRGPYHRCAEPTEPLLVTDLPEPLRTIIGGMQVPGVSFARTMSFDPEALTSCQRYRED